MYSYRPPTYGRAKAGRPATFVTYIQQLCEGTGCSPEDLPEAMNDREKWRERVRDIRASGTTRWGWKLQLKIYKFIKFRHFNQVVLTIWIPFDFLSVIVLKSSRCHPVAAQSWWIQVFAGQLTLVCPQENVTQFVRLPYFCSAQNVLLGLRDRREDGSVASKICSK